MSKSRGGVVWFTGLPGSGKSSIARRLQEAFQAQGKNAFVLDGDFIRTGLSKDLGFSPADRKENIRRVGEVAKLFSQAQVLCLVACISPYQSDRDAARALLERGRFFEVYCAATVEECEARDPKGLYQKAKAGEIKEFTGISAPYEVPLTPELRLETGKESLEGSAKKVVDLLRQHGMI